MDIPKVRLAPIPTAKHHYTKPIFPRLVASFGIYCYFCIAYRYLINSNWRTTKYASVVFTAVLGLMWPLAYYNTGGLMNPWFTIFVDLDQSFAQGITQVLYSMAVIELAKSGLEATTYELVVSVGNSALFVAGVLSTQYLLAVGATGCEDDDVDACPDNTVSLKNKQAYEDTDGPEKFTNYTLLLLGVQIIGAIAFVPFLPASKEECVEWKRRGEELGNSDTRAYIALSLSIVVILYGIIATIMLLDTDTNCMMWIGGSGC